MRRRSARTCVGGVRRRRWCRAGTSKLDLAATVARPTIDPVHRAVVELWAVKQDIDERAPVGPQAAELFGRDDNGPLHAAIGHDLRSVGVGATHNFAEARLGVLQGPSFRHSTPWSDQSSQTGI